MRRECRRFHREVLRAVDGELHFEAGERLRRHAKSCPGCEVEWRRQRRLDSSAL